MNTSLARDLVNSIQKSWKATDNAFKVVEKAGMHLGAGTREEILVDALVVTMKMLDERLRLVEKLVLGADSGIGG